MKFSVNVPDSVAEAAKEAATAAGVSPAEWTRRALLAALHPPEVTAAPNENLESTLNDLARTQAERDQLAADVADLRRDLEHRDQVLAERADEIRWLRGEVSKLNDKLTPAALPEKAGTGRRWWEFWKVKE